MLFPSELVHLPANDLARGVKLGAEKAVAKHFKRHIDHNQQTIRGDCIESNDQNVEKREAPGQKCMCVCVC